MGKFDGVLFFTDYDDTLYNSHFTVSPENRAAARDRKSTRLNPSHAT